MLCLNSLFPLLLILVSLETTSPVICSHFILLSSFQVAQSSGQLSALSSHDHCRGECSLPASPPEALSTAGSQDPTFLCHLLCWVFSFPRPLCMEASGGKGWSIPGLSPLMPALFACFGVVILVSLIALNGLPW